MRTQQEIIKRIEEIKDGDFFGFETSDLINYLDFETAKPFLKDTATPESWQSAREENGTIGDTYECAKKELIEYMPFAWDKANDCRGLSAARSLNHFSAWLWLMGEDAMVRNIKAGYSYYGKPHLVMICEKFGIDWKSLDNGAWVNDESDEAATAEEVLNKR